MAENDTMRAIGILNREIVDRFNVGKPVRFTVEGKPKLRILSFEPFTYELYEDRRLAPEIFGTLALRGLLHRPHITDGVVITVAGSAGRDTYGFDIDAKVPEDLVKITALAAVLGHPEIRFIEA